MEGIELALRDIVEELKDLNKNNVEIARALRNVEAALGDLYRENSINGKWLFDTTTGKWNKCSLLPDANDIKLPEDLDNIK